jgi:hypothetical protein
MDLNRLHLLGRILGFISAWACRRSCAGVVS